MVGHYKLSQLDQKVLLEIIDNGIGFDIEQAYTLEQLQAMTDDERLNCLVNVDKPLENLPVVRVSSEQAQRIRQGQQLTVEESFRGLVRMYCEQAFLGLGEMLLNGKLAPKKLFHLNNEIA